MKTLKLTAELIPEEEGGDTVYCPELDIYTQGETESECLANLREAAELHLEELGERARPHPDPRPLNPAPHRSPIARRAVFC